MFKHGLIILFLIVNGCLYSSNVQLARIHFTKVKNDEQIDTLLVLLQKENSPIANAYKGAYTIMKAKYVSSPFKKYAFFNEGKNLLEKAVAKSPDNIEIRCLRALIQVNLPKFLNYYEEISSDVDFVLTNIRTSDLSKEIKYKIITNLVAANLISDKDQTALINRINHERNRSYTSR